jgi:hypothetical protein
MTQKQRQHFIHMVLRNANRMAMRAQSHRDASRMINSATDRARSLGFSMADRHNTAERLMGCVRIIEKAFDVRLAVMSPADQDERVGGISTDWTEPY